MKFINLQKVVLTAGLAMFSMFFGSGNLVFPLMVGTQAMDKMGYAMLGLLITGVIVPFLGLIGVILYAGNKAKYFAAIGKKPAFILMFIILAMLGPFGAIPRCIMVAYGGISLFAPHFPCWLFSALFCLTTLGFLWNPNRIIPIIGLYLTPLFLIGIIIISIGGLFFSDMIIPIGQLSGREAFGIGLTGGYQTMDLLTAFFFAATTITYLKKSVSSRNTNKLFKMSLIASLIGIGSVGIIYMGFVALGAKHAGALMLVHPEQMLATIAGNVLGPIAIPMVAFIIVIACLTTAVILGVLFAEFIQEDISQERLGRRQAVIVTLGISCLISLIGFDSLRLLMGNVLEVAYPALIVLTIANIVCKIWRVPYFGQWGFWLTTIMSTVFYIVK